MRNIALLFACALSFTACQVSYQTNPPFTNVEKMVELKPGMSYEQVSQTLGIPPHNILNTQEEGGSIVQYNYRIKDRRIKIPVEPKKQEEFIHSEGYQKEGELWYKTESQRLYVFFKDGKMKSMLTDAGIEDAEYLMVINNNIKFLAKEDFNKIKTYRVGAGSTYLVVKDSTSVIYTLPGKDTKANPLNTMVSQTKTKTGKIITGVLVSSLVVFLLISLAN